jgi:P27 family predicted phage terminase small subunit
MRGRKPKPVEQRHREGNPGHRDVPEAVLVGGRPRLEECSEPPEHLPAPAKEFWRFSVERLIEAGIVDLVDLPALEGLCITYARARQAGRVVERVGHFQVGTRGQTIQHPALRVEREAWRDFYSMAEHFAITPIARTRLGLANLQGKRLREEMGDALGTPDLTPIEA